MQTNLYSLIDQAQTILPRLERITPDSSWAHIATGIRRSLLRLLEHPGEDTASLQAVLNRGYEILDNAAKEKLR